MAVARVDFDELAFFDEEGNVNDFASLERRGFLDVAGGVASDAFSAFDDADVDAGWHLDLNGFVFDEKDFDLKVFDQIVFGVSEKIGGKSHRIVSGRVDEDEIAAVFIGILELLAADVDEFDLVGGAEADVGGFTGADVADDGLDEGAQVARGAVHDFKDDGDVSIVANGLSFAEIVSCWHIE